MVAAMSHRPAITEGMRFLFRAFLRYACVAIMLALAGCGRFGSSALVFAPATLPACKGPLISVHVRWNAEAETSGPVSIYVSSPEEPRKLWLIAAPKGERNTGRWMHDGSTLTLRNAKGRVLAVRTLETASCAKSGS